MPTQLGKEFYLREIGVQTPVSLVCFEPEEVVSAVPQPTGLNEIIEQAKQCDRCALSQLRTQVVLGCGNHDADLLFIGAAPDAEEDKQGQGYCGEVGELFDAILASIGLTREQVYQLNIVQCSPPNHRDPKPEELHACKTWLDLQIAHVKPKVICVLGRVAAQALFQADATLNDLRQGWHVYQEIPALVSFHPAYLLRSPKQKRKSWEDFILLKRRLS
jgi:DNA polymerase